MTVNLGEFIFLEALQVKYVFLLTVTRVTYSAYKFYSQMCLATYSDLSKEFWIGLYINQTRTNTWFWLDTLTHYNESWAPWCHPCPAYPDSNEPSGQSNEKCVRQHAAYWLDASCDGWPNGNRKYNYLCERGEFSEIM